MTIFWHWEIDPLKQTIVQGAKAQLEARDGKAKNQKWIREVGLHVPIFGGPKNGSETIGHMTLHNRDVIFVDDDGYGKEGLGIFWIEGYPHPLCGKAAVVHREVYYGDETLSPPEMSLKELTSYVRFTDVVTSGEVMPPHDASPEELARMFAHKPEFIEQFRKLAGTGIVCGHPISRPATVAGHIFAERDGI